MTSPAENCYLSVVIPAYNEEVRIGKTLDHVLEYLSQQSYSWEVIVVNDGSMDKTLEVVRETAGDRPVTILDNVQNRGKGYSVTRGVLTAKGKYILFSDADESTPIKEVEKLLPEMENGAGVAMGSRALDRSTVKVHQSFLREFMGRVFNVFVRFINVGGFLDTQCGFKCFEQEAAREVFSRQRIAGFCFDVETVFLAVKRGYRVAEVPVEWYNSPRSTVNPLSDSLKMFVDLVRIRWFWIQGLYKSKVWTDENVAIGSQSSEPSTSE